MNKRIVIIGAIAIGATTAARATDSSVPHLKADQVHALGIDGFDVTVAIIDTGVDSSHPGLAGHIRAGGARTGCGTSTTTAR
jgi:subtilisin family serine protease